MRTVVLGAGPAGLFTAIALARRGHDLVVVDRDPGPPPDGRAWRRRGVMQFQHAHSFRKQVVEALQVEMPDVLVDLVAASAVILPTVLLCRRAVFERVLRERAAAEPRITLLTGHVDTVVQHRGRAVGARVDGATLPADLVIDASGRASRVTAGLRPLAEGGPCGAAYVTRQYRLRSEADAGTVNSPIGLSMGYRGYNLIVFLHDNRTFSVNLVHAGEDRRLRELRHEHVFEAAIGTIPLFREWTHPDRAFPITDVLPGGRLHNTYCGQLDESGRPVLPGMISVGDAVCTTTPLAGRGVALALMQSRALVQLLNEHRADFYSAATAFDDWCTEHIKPWFDDHTYVDEDRLRRWAGHDIDMTRTLPSDLIVAAADADSGLQPIVGPYAAMDAMPASLAAAESRARAVYAGGWRPRIPPGPDKDQLGQLCAELSPVVRRSLATASLDSPV